MVYFIRLFRCRLSLSFTYYTLVLASISLSAIAAVLSSVLSSMEETTVEGIAFKGYHIENSLCLASDMVNVTKMTKGRVISCRSGIKSKAGCSARVPAISTLAGDGCIDNATPKKT
jgi:hypothetical protein